MLKMSAERFVSFSPPAMFSSGVWLVLAAGGYSGMNLALELDDDTPPRLIVFARPKENAPPLPTASLAKWPIEPRRANNRFVWTKFKFDEFGKLMAPISDLVNREQAKFILTMLKFDAEHVDKLWPLSGSIGTTVTMR